ncbi:hypothetical protein M5D96_003388, partial [Drosophila gunungcola]
MSCRLTSETRKYIATAQQDGVPVAAKSENSEFILTSGSNAPPNPQQAC